MSAATTEALVLKLIAILNEHKFLDALSLATPSATWWNSGVKEQNPLAGTRSSEERMKAILAIPDVRDGIVIEVISIVVDEKGEKAAMEVLAKIKESDGSYQYRNEIFMAFEVKEGKIDSVREFMDYYPVEKYLKGKNAPAGE
ncbi:hypothetical protein CPB83DRAFT_844988 [Crepidotus variabilis]|uniref:SnoaL-like domain-containing protein n=1 Tax=Crepidotus variabilis TaxID=179855 RepID=A0A9P6ERE5_9AGAR|nr:hypothetical protein CPB83DRAFT_844988 [Crepidotus variabilis]